MKIKTIISSICLMLLAVSCSMGDEVLDEVGKVVTEEESRTDIYAEFDLALTGGTLQTKSAAREAPDNSKTTEGVINSCYIAAFLGDESALTNESEIIASAFYNTYQGGDAIVSAPTGDNPNIYALGNHMLIKIPVRNAAATDKPRVTFVAVANILSADVKNDQDGFVANCKTYGDILGRRITKTDPNIFVKFGSTTISDYKVREKVLDQCIDGVNCTKVEIPVHQLTSAIQLEEFKVYKKIQTGADSNGKPAFSEETISDANVVSVSLLNAVTSTYVKKADPSVILRTSSVGPLSVGDDNPFHPDYNDPSVSPKPTYGNISDIRFYTYANESNDVNKQTALKVVYTVNGVESTSTFKIKTDGAARIQSGNIYKLYVTITNGTAVGTCTVNDFISNTVTGTWEEVIK